MVKRASEGLIIRYGEGAAKLEGAALTKFITVLNEYLGFLDKLNKRIREEQIAALLPKLDLAKRADFEGDKNTPPKKIEKLEKNSSAAKRPEAEERGNALRRRTQSVGADFVNAQGAEHIINWELASTPECRQLITKFKQIEQYLEPPFVVESVPRVRKAKSAEEKTNTKMKKQARTKTADENLSAAEKEEAEKAQKKSGKARARKSERARDRREKHCPRTFRLRPERRPQRVHRPALQRPGRNDRRATLGNHHGSRAPHAPASAARRHRRVRDHLHHANGRRRRSPQKIHRRQRAGREESGYLGCVGRECSCYASTIRALPRALSPLPP
jgi:chemotaxis protein histidine kinase CheA